ncbi:esterase-like activity of phytase family protein [Pararhodobacter sp.]|uniref:esterase-like activity of phytase family protein n=1 Tax=Pararhodobacter sp. TaxID=2127056 RepID=UPI002FDF8D69
MPLTRRLFLTLAAASALPLGRPAGAIVARADSLYHWIGGGPFFGGFSGLHLSDDRSRALVISDRGFALQVRLLRDAQGRLQGVEKLGHWILRDAEGQEMANHRADAEGVDIGPDGTIYISFEGAQSRVHAYRRIDGRARLLPVVPDWRRLPNNASLESLAVDAAGVVHVLPEGVLDGGHPLYRLRDGWQVAGIIPSRGGFRPVGMDFGPDGNLYLLERKFRLAFFASRISRLRPGAWDRPETLVETSLGQLDNHEGISVTRDRAGQLWATTISDDNQIRLQRTEIAEFRLPEG